MICCVTALVLDLRKDWAQRSQTMLCQRSCRRWSNFCTFFYCFYYVLYAIGEFYSSQWELRRGQCDRVFGPAGCNKDGGNPLCFLNCCVVFVPWLELMGYGSLMWNIMWLVDLVRYTVQPLQPEKLFGIHLVYYYHVLTWVVTGLIAFNFDLSRLSMMSCVKAEIVMMPCLLRRGTIHEAIPWVHLVGFVLMCAAISFMVQRYVRAGALSTHETVFTRQSRARTLGCSVRKHIRQQCFHIAALFLCWALILLDNLLYTSAGDSKWECSPDNVLPYFSVTAFAGLGVMLNVDMLRDLVRSCAASCARRGSRQPSVRIAERSPRACEGSPRLQGRGLDEELVLNEAGTASESLPVGRRASRRISSLGMDLDRRLSMASTGYQCIDFAEMLEYLIDFLQEEESLLVSMMQSREQSLASTLLDSVPSEAPTAAPTREAKEVQMAVLRCGALLDDNTAVQVDTVMSTRPNTGLAETSFTVVAPRTFAYLRHMWGIDTVRLLNTIGQADLTTLRTAGKSGFSWLAASRFVLKTVSEEEVRQLRIMLPAYRRHMEEHPTSLLCHIYGCFTFKNSLGFPLHVVVMDNLSYFSSGIARASSSGSSAQVSSEAEQQLFDMKSEFQDSGFVQKFPGGLLLPAEHRQTVIEALAADFQFLMDCGVVDYSLLLGAWETPSSFARADGRSSADPPSGSARSYQAEVGPALFRSTGSSFALRQTVASEGTRLVMRLGIIDFLVPFNARKWTESRLKRTLRMAEKVTITAPNNYAQRLENFLQSKVFPSSPSSDSDLKEVGSCFPEAE